MMVGSTRVAIVAATLVALRTFLRVELPLIMPGLLAALCLSFVLMAGDLTASVFLPGPNTPVIGSVILDRFENGSHPVVAALGAVMTVMTVTVVGGAQLPNRRFLSADRGRAAAM